ncbi:hypothetical protein BU14_0493s0001 [Porphyra umbilicalis]|uniref:Protein kinase domain-containing protein n=1 Tax=Porphyra umbilicalis TaxID=2786 RepID=A0A1X6NTL7_PORUM|nr:hypothetical protein BU14_0493s0001 [Porphyra umbilicalis]|eukprot:OSX71856.1 hypothetical protein BU14_0493s0001 [Porphyra umbilicalis]
MADPPSSSRAPRSTEEERKAREERKREASRVASRDFFRVPLSAHAYAVEGLIGTGAYGVVCSAVMSGVGERVAIKRIKAVLNSYPFATRILRELKFMRLLRRHENIITVRDVLVPGERDRFNDVFVVSELMPIDLAKLLRTTTTLSPEHVKYLMFQLLRAVHFMHAANVLHRDIKPNNVLVNKKCELRVCDFGLARAAFDDDPDPGFWTDYIATRWYRAPELILTLLTNYSTAIDIWSVGCIFAEILSRGEPLFPGQSPQHQFSLIVNVTGTPSEEEISQLRNTSAQRTMRSLPRSPRRPLSTLFPDADPDALDVMSKMLEFSPEKRISALDALRHPYFAKFACMGLGATAEPVSRRDFLFERHRLTPEGMRKEFLREIAHYHPEVRQELLAEAAAAGAAGGAGGGDGGGLAPIADKDVVEGAAAAAGAGHNRRVTARMAGSFETALGNDAAAAANGNGTHAAAGAHTVGEDDMETMNPEYQRRGDEYRSNTMDEQVLDRLNTRV